MKMHSPKAKGLRKREETLEEEIEHTVDRLVASLRELLLLLVRLIREREEIRWPQ